MSTPVMHMSGYRPAPSRRADAARERMQRVQPMMQRYAAEDGWGIHDAEPTPKGGYSNYTEYPTEEVVLEDLWCNGAADRAPPHTLPPAPPLADAAPTHAVAVRFSKTDALALTSPTCLQDEHGGTYTFDGFLVLCHCAVEVPVLQFLCGGALVEARCEAVAVPPVLHDGVERAAVLAVETLLYRELLQREAAGFHAMPRFVDAAGKLLPPSAVRSCLGTRTPTVLEWLLESRQTYAPVLPALLSQLVWFCRVDLLQTMIGVEFKDRSLLRRAFVHSARRGPPVLVAPAELTNQRLEFLGDAVLEFVTTHHLFCCFSRSWEGDLTYMRSEMVNNKILTTFALRLGFDELLLHAEADRRGVRFAEDADAYFKLLADGFEAFLGALYLDAGVDACRQLVAKCLYPRCSELPLRRFWLRAAKVPYVPPDKIALEDGGEELEPLLEFQRVSGIQFRHLGLLRQATTHPSFYMARKGAWKPPMDDEGQPMHNQRLEHLGDAALQLAASDYLFHHFPEHQEGKLSLLRSALVNNPFLCDAMTTCGLHHCMRYNDDQIEESGKARRGMLSDGFEAFLGALFLDRQPFGIAAVKVFCEQVIFPFSKRLLSGRRWMDPKTRLYYCLSKFNLRQPTHLHLKQSFRVVEEHGPSHEKMFVVGCYLNGTQVAEARGQSHRDAEMGAARLACEALGLNEGLELAPDLEVATPDGDEAIAFGDEGEDEGEGEGEEAGA